ncbi:MAG: polymer-forming cytoskeletal protein [Candidatus Kappaea frigidicola]|nr:polymer-forming cytoskeletal protein [Candidatus Kappaea frigidicola]
MFKGSKRDAESKKSKVLDVDASMQGSLVFKDPVDLKISGQFEGSLDTRGNLTVGENASVNAEVKGENVTICGKVVGDIITTSKLTLSRTARIIGDIKTPVLKVEEGAVLQGNCQMVSGDEPSSKKKEILNSKQLAEYLEVDSDEVNEWIKNRKIPAFKESDEWKFDKAKIDAWVVSEKIK